MLNFEIGPMAALSGESLVAVIFAALILIAVPLFLFFAEYRMTKKDKKYGQYLLAGVFASAILFGIFSLFIGILLAVIYLMASHTSSASKP